MSRRFSRSGTISLIALKWRAVRPNKDQGLPERVMKKIAYETILDNIADGVFTVDSELKITSFNKSAEQITGVPSEEAIGRRCREVLRTNICEESCALLQTMTTGKTMLHLVA